ncbi:MAG TPA: histidinol-phosphate transaminase [Candidatus Saccharimonadales bacterium]|nr:histidinol-phosphate transaminase [Candidatus Saccharimonadales bacterium]
MQTANQFICDLQPYQPGLPIEQVAREYGIAPEKIIKLASNENPLGPSPKAQAAAEAALKEAHRYPEQHALRAALAAKFDLDTRWLVIGNGSNDIIDLIARTYLDAGDESIVSQYAFAMYQNAIQSVGAATVTVPAKEYGHDLDAMLAAITPRTKVVWIANPNNPTGTYVPYNQVKAFLDAVPQEVMVVLDEAYYEYLSPDDQEDSLHWPIGYPNLIVLRTFSKIYGLAGLRVGYGVASAEVADLLNRVRLPFNVTSTSVAAAMAALDDDDFVKRSYELNLEGRKRLLDSLEILGLECLPAYGNFVTCNAGDAGAVHQALLQQGIIARPLKPYGLDDWLRVSVGLPAENERFLAVLEQVLDSPAAKE